MRWFALGALMTILSGSASGQHHGHHGNPDDLDGYIAKMEEPARDEWQKPDEVVRALALSPAAVVCDVGAGPGYFALRIARAVDKGRVFAVDVEPRMLERLRERIAKAGARNLTPVLALDDDPLLPKAACDLVLVVDTFHHFSDGAAYLRRLGESLRPGGRLVNIDFHKRELPVGPRLEHKVAREDFLAQAKRAGFEVIDEPTFLPYQYFLTLKKKP
jgi:ubiquinone/menaquinone biosynthesis C-methylase UbiE